MPFAVTSFYKTRLTVHGVTNEPARNAVFVPNSDISDDEDLCDEDKPMEFGDEVDVVDENVESSEFEDDNESESEEVDAPQESGEDEFSDEDETPTREKRQKQRAEQYRWRKRAPMVVILSFSGAGFPNPPAEELSPLQFFKRFFSDDLIAHIVEQTILYSMQRSNKNVNTNSSEIEQFIGILLMMGIVKYPQYHMHWSPETRIPAIADCMSINRFQKLKCYFHMNDNSKMPPRDDPSYDKLFRVRPMLDSIVRNCRNLPQEECHSIDEQIIPTKARSSSRQYLPEKPHKWGFKVWARCGVSGIIYDFDVYVGRKDDTNDSPQYGKVGAVVIKLVEFLPKYVGHKVFLITYLQA